MPSLKTPLVLLESNTAGQNDAAITVLLNSLVAPYELELPAGTFQVAQGIRLTNVSDVTVFGQGAATVIVCTSKSAPLKALNCERVTFRDFDVVTPWDEKKGAIDCNGVRVTKTSSNVTITNVHVRQNTESGGTELIYGVAESGSDGYCNGSSGTWRYGT